MFASQKLEISKSRRLAWSDPVGRWGPLKNLAPQFNKMTLTFTLQNPTLTVSIPKTENIMQVTISTKYQIVIPKPAREHLNLKPKQKLTVIEKDKMLILIPQTSLDDLRGIATGADTDNYREKEDRFI